MTHRLKALRTMVLLAWVAAVTLGGTAYGQAIQESYTITADTPLRSGPGASYPAVTTLPEGIQVSVVGKQGRWLKVVSKHGGKPGYVDEQFAARSATSQRRSTSVAGPYRTLREVDLRQGPGVKYPKIARIPADITVHVVRAEGDWLRVESKKGGKPGYVDKRDVERWQER